MKNQKYTTFSTKDLSPERCLSQAQDRIVQLQASVGFAQKQSSRASRALGSIWLFLLLLGAFVMQGCFPTQKDVVILAKASKTRALVAASATEQDAQFKQTKAILERRLQDLGVKGFSVRVQGQKLSVSLPKLPVAQTKMIKELLLVRQALVHAWPLAKDSSYLLQVKEALVSKIYKISSDVHVVMDAWKAPEQKRRQTWVLEGPERSSLEATLQKLAKQDERLQLPKHQELVYRQRKGKRWQVYVVDKQRGMVIKRFLSVDAVKGAGMAAGYKLRMHGKDAMHFQRITRENLGNRLFLMIDNQVGLAPVVMAEIAGGQIQLTASSEEQERPFLRAMLAGGSLPFPLTIIKTSTL